MSWDSKTVPPRRRQNSTAASGRSRGLSLHNRTGPKGAGIPGGTASNGLGTPVKIDSKSAHTADPFLQAFLSPVFDPAEYLNATLPVLQGSSPSGAASLRSTSSKPSSSSSTATSVPLADLSTEAQTLLTQLNAHTTRLTTTLSQLTEDILRSGSRLAYEVELLRGETLSLAETLSEGPLRADLERFFPAGLQDAASSQPAARRASLVSNAAIPPTPATATTTTAPLAAVGTADEDAQGEPHAGGAPDPPPPPPPARATDEPPFISHLRTLTLVRARLDAVIKTFGDAMEFVFPPSEISVSSGFLSVSAPDFPDRRSSSSSSDGHMSTEDKGQQILKKIRDEIAGLLNNSNSNSSGSSSTTTVTYDEKIKGIEDATKRVEQIKELSTVWKGTAEEKGRQKFVESLARMVEDRHRELVREMETLSDANASGLRKGQQQQQQSQQQQQQQQAGSLDASGSASSGGPAAATSSTTESRGPLGGYGFMNQWQKIRGGL